MIYVTVSAVLVKVARGLGAWELEPSFLLLCEVVKLDHIVSVKFIFYIEEGRRQEQGKLKK